MIDFIDKTSEKSGTPLNRANLMGVQGFVNQTITFVNGVITETTDSGQVKTTKFNDDGSIVEKFVGEKTITKTTRFKNNQIKEELS